MSDTLILGGTTVPPLAENATVFEDGDWRLERTNHHVLGPMWLLYERCCGFWLSRGYIVRRDDGYWYLCLSPEHERPQSERITCDLDQAIGALWAAREAS